MFRGGLPGLFDKVGSRRRSKSGGMDGVGEIRQNNEIPSAKHSWAGTHYRGIGYDPSGIATYSQVGAQFGFSATLHVHGVTNIQTSSQAAAALHQPRLPTPRHN